MNSAATTLFDAAELKTRFAGKAELLRRIIKIFDEQTPQLLGRLRHAVRRGDAAAVEWTAHTLKGSLGQLGAHTTAELAAQLEQAARTSAPGRSEVLLKDLEAQAAQLQRMLKDLANSPDL
ncbi:MAG TPA: Hpt domain-containing protein [Verrucomicrobiae bacterium]|nr:Hpt domain-containing protein [Verrucomicrobiae bacterium]